MRLSFTVVSILLLSLFPIFCEAASSEIPVLDSTDLFSQDQARTLKENLVQLFNTRNISMVVMTTESLNGDSIEAVAEREFRRLKIGSKGVDNGLLFLIVPKEREMRLEVGYGLEGDIPDVIAKRLLDDHVEPLFKQGKYFEATQLLIEKIQNRSYSLPPNKYVIPTRNNESYFLILFVFLLCGLFISAVHFFAGPIEDKKEMLEMLQEKRPPKFQSALEREPSCRKKVNFSFAFYWLAFGAFLVFFFSSNRAYELSYQFLGTFVLDFIALGIAVMNSKIYTWKSLYDEAPESVRRLIQNKMISRGYQYNSTSGFYEPPGTFGNSGSGGDEGSLSDGGSSGGGGASSNW